MARNDRSYIAKRDQLKSVARRQNLPCWLCGQSIDFDLPWKHPMSFTADHIDPIALGGSMTGELRPAHRSCNSRRGVGRGTVPTVKPVPTSVDWYGHR
ncbi:HNH endonuclease [Nesterenkonia rhizosphaerae]|uniref:HNH endonuclease n=1 Tax=Nesterenkonia rhizosphaerae TaxID=1348272 RepID=UPI003CD06ECC